MAFTVPDKKTIPELEEETLKFWKENKTFEKSVERNSKDNLYVFYDGPPFISGLPHYGHILGSVAKDVVPRYWTMKGKRVERLWGWDAHGLTVENRVQEVLGIKNRRDIESYGLEKFTKACYEYTSKTSAEWEWYVDRIGRWVDFEDAYRTTDQKYMESIMWAFKQLYNKECIYEGIRTSLYCPTCGTPVSDFEIAMDNSYKDAEDPSIIVKFPVITNGKFKGINILAWTTTPWTLPSNRALVVD
ncbi:MAG: class I tRNA ligase family protein, partial [Patescibacteria group bacterium]